MKALGFMAALGLFLAPPTAKSSPDSLRSAALQSAVDHYNALETADRLAAALGANASDAKYLRSLKGKLPLARMTEGNIRIDGISQALVFVNPAKRELAIGTKRIRLEAGGSAEVRIREIEIALRHENASVISFLVPKAHAITPLGAAGVYAAGVVGIGALCMFGEVWVRSMEEATKYCALHSFGWPVMLPVGILWGLVSAAIAGEGDYPKDLECHQDGSIGFTAANGRKATLRQASGNKLVSEPPMTSAPGKTASHAFTALKATCPTAKSALAKLNAASPARPGASEAIGITRAGGIE